MRALIHILLASSLFIVSCSSDERTETDISITEENPGSDLAVQTTPAAVDGMTYAVDFHESAKNEMSQDTLSFNDGMFHSRACDEYGFGASSYTATSEDGVTTFSATTTSQEEGEMNWSGTLSGNSIEGRVTWVKEGQDPVDYEFHGGAI